MATTVELVQIAMNSSTNTGRGSGAEAPDSTSMSLLDRVKAQDPKAWERLVKLYGPLVYGWCRRSGLKAEDAADVVQEVFAGVAVGLGKFRRDQPGDSFRGWLRGIARHKIGDHFRSRQGRPEVRGGTDAQQQFLAIPGPIESVSASDQSNDDSLLSHCMLELVRAEFENRTWRAFWQVVANGRSPVDVADDLGMTLHAVYKAKSRVLRRLRQEFSDLGS